MQALLNHLIRASLQRRWLVIWASVGLCLAGTFVVLGMPVDVFPELQAPTVEILTEAPGYAAEDIELAVSFPIETAVNGLPGIRRVRSSSANGLSIVWVEFGFDTDIFRARQLVTERLAIAAEQLPEGVHAPEMAPIASVTGEVMLLALGSDGPVSPLELRRVAEFDLRTRLLAVNGVAQVTAIGGELPEYQVLVRPHDLQRFGLSLADVVAAAGEAHAPAGGGYLDDVDGRELPLRLHSGVGDAADVAATVVGEWRGIPVTLHQVADVGVGAAPKRGTGTANALDAVILTIKKNPGTNTLALTAELDRVLEEFRRTMVPGMTLETGVYRQADFIQVAVDNVVVALRDGVIFVLIVLVLFLMNVRTTFITLTALALSVPAALVVPPAAGLTINVMTLGGLAVAIGSLVDDAIVDVENVFRRLRENAARPAAERRPVLTVVYEASVEVRTAILLATAVIVLVFVPLFFLTGIEGRFFRPLGAAYVVSLAASLVVAMTLTPVLCYFLLGRGRAVEQPESALVRWLKRGYDRALAACLARPGAVLAVAGGLVVASAALATTYGSSFLPAFNEGTITVFLDSPPSTSLQESDRVARTVEARLAALPGVAAVTRRTGRAENDSHAHGVTTSEMDLRLLPGHDIDAVRGAVRALLANVPGLTTQLGGPIAHRLSHILSGTPADLAIKVFGADLDTLRAIAREVEGALAPLPGVRDLVANREMLVDTLPVVLDREALARHGFTAKSAAEQLETAFRGRTVGAVTQGGSRLNLVVRMAPEARATPDDVRDLILEGAGGALVRVRSLARVDEERAAGMVTRENVKRKAVISCNVAEGHNLGDLVATVRDRVDPIVARYAGCFVEYGGQFEAQAEAARRIGWSSAAVLLAIVAILYASYRTWRPVGLVLANLPLALVGGVVAMFLAGSPNPVGNLVALLSGGAYVAPVVSIASLVGFIGLAGMAARNGLLLISHYYHLMETEGEAPAAAVPRAARERLVPILMTALTSALALVPLVWQRGSVGSELQYPVAVVILGGLVSSTVLNLAVIPVGLSLWGGGPRPVVAKELT